MALLGSAGRILRLILLLQLLGVSGAFVGVAHGGASRLTARSAPRGGIFRSPAGTQRRGHQVGTVSWTRRLSATSPSLLPAKRNGGDGSGWDRRAGTRRQQRDVLIIGGGLAGLSAALYLSQLDPSRHITILDREDPIAGDADDGGASKKTAVGSMAAAGMLAPQSERLPQGPYLDLCLASRGMFPDFCDLVESLARDSGTEGHRYLAANGPAGGAGASTSAASSSSSSSPTDPLQPWSVGYMCTGGFLAPAMAGDAVATWAPPEDSGAATWLDSVQVRELEPHLHPTNVVGGWWFPQDASVDARRLTRSLRAACAGAGMQLLLGPEHEIASLDLADDACRGVWLAGGRYLGARTVLVANGAWMRNLLPVPVQPHKGQSLSLRMPADRPPLLRRVIFAQDSYIVPKADGRIVVGATVEAGSFDANVTPAGLLHIMTYALQLVPGLKDLPIEETWAGLRPTTPDKAPILGKTPWQNLFVAGGYWRNGVLLAPKTGELMAQLIAGEPLSPEDEALLNAFKWDRFTEKGGGAALAANTRYAASMHPVHSRTSGFGVAAAVGTELGSYSSARAATDERSRDRNALWDDESSEEAFERAAQMGKQDGQAFSLGDDDATSDSEVDTVTALPLPPGEHVAKLEPYEGSPDAITVTSSPAEDSIESKERRKLTESSGQKIPSSEVAQSTNHLDLVYQKIKENKAKQMVQWDSSDSSEEERPDPGFRIYGKHPDTGEYIEVPPYTSPGDFQDSLKRTTEKTGSANPSSKSVNVGDEAVASVNGAAAPSMTGEGYSETSYDGYQVIQQANSRGTREEELAAMREARRKNRLGQQSIDMAKIGAQRIDEDEIQPC